jgi:hypothetical protein
MVCSEIPLIIFGKIIDDTREGITLNYRELVN